MTENTYYVGMMSGTSLDGVDAVLTDANYRVLAHVQQDIPAELRQLCLDLVTEQTLNLQWAKQAEFDITELYAAAYQQLMQASFASAESKKQPANKGQEKLKIAGIGAHGQTICHFPNTNKPYTWQLLNPAKLALMTGQTVVCDFRSKVIAAGGQGAPLAPIFHHAFFATFFADDSHYVVVNIGGIANISVIDQQQQTCLGWDTGPGNALMDAWCMSHTGKAYDAAGQWGRGGEILYPLLHTLLNDPYFLPAAQDQSGKALASKSTGRDYFNLSWLDTYLEPFADCSPQDIMRTLTQLTAKTIVHEIVRATNLDCRLAQFQLSNIVIAGGGARNTLLMDDLQQLVSVAWADSIISPVVQTSDALGIDAQCLEALGFAYLAAQTLQGRSVSCAVKNKQQQLILGGIYH